MFKDIASELISDRVIDAGVSRSILHVLPLHMKLCRGGLVRTSDDRDVNSWSFELGDCYTD